MIGEPRAHVDQRLEVDALAAEAGERAVATAERGLGHAQRGFGVEPGAALERAHHVDERRALAHRPDRFVACRELAATLAAEEPRALFEEERVSLLLVGAARRADPEDADREPPGARAWE